MKIINIFFLIIERKIMTCEGKNFKNDIKKIHEKIIFVYSFNIYHN